MRFHYGGEDLHLNPAVLLRAVRGVNAPPPSVIASVRERGLSPPGPR